jgi:hypothetical protein
LRRPLPFTVPPSSSNGSKIRCRSDERTDCLSGQPSRTSTFPSLSPFHGAAAIN